uniref:ATP synthase F0 subunit 8 n=1 Tax=Allonautilus scrobiculatus TaxID=34575 RepID=A0A0F6QMZ3_9MOLL|nr:ATP synthase F0 subunit 8 [Allonautilus scrobiculatus]AKE32136.1 ATP synthase F0 subunit 8 [Allonautilus scrobiculatus]
MPQLSPLNWLLIMSLFWFGLITLSVIIFWTKTKLFSYKHHHTPSLPSHYKWW